jgi:hypothetical protein
MRLKEGQAMKRKAKSGKRIFAASACAAMLGMGLVGATGSSATTASDWGPGFKDCGFFHAEYKIHVFAKGISCAKARRIQKVYWLAPKSRTEEVITRRGPVYIKLKRFPGWKCMSGAGGGDCSKGQKVAGYSDMPGE